MVENLLNHKLTCLAMTWRFQNFQRNENSSGFFHLVDHEIKRYFISIEKIKRALKAISEITLNLKPFTFNLLPAVINKSRGTEANMPHILLFPTSQELGLSQVTS